MSRVRECGRASHTAYAVLGEALFASAKAVSFHAFDPDKLLAGAICTAVG